MRILLDTHIVLWALTDDSRLPKPARELIVDPGNDVHVSAACIWEIAIKHGLGRDTMPVAPGPALAWCREAGYHLLAITADHAAAVHTLPMVHRDPFDRIIVAQALHEPMHLITHDENVAMYDTSIMLV